MEYSLVDVRNDQFWFFESYAEESRIFNLATDWVRLFSWQRSLAVCGLVIFTIGAIRNRNLEASFISAIGATLFLGGVISCVGGHIMESCFAPFTFWLYLCLVLFAVRAAVSAVTTKRQLSSSRLQLVAVVICMFLAISLIVSSSATRSREASAAQSNPDLSPQTSLDGYIDSSWLEYFNKAQTIPKDAVVIEEYWGLLSAERRSFAPWKVDSVIHALGSQRELSREAMKSADYLVSSREATSQYFFWGISQNYWFYEEVLRGHWKVSAVSPLTILWERSDIEPPQLVPAECSLFDGKKAGLSFEAPRPGLYEVNFRYKIQSHGALLALVAPTFPDQHLPVSLDPGGSIASFPVYVAESGKVNIAPEMLPTGAGTIEVSSCVINLLPEPSSDFMPAAAPLYKQDHTEEE